MNAVIAKSDAAGKSRRKPVLKRKSPGIAIMIAVGKPKKGMGDGPMREARSPMRGPKTRIAELEARIAELEAKLAAMGEEEGEDEGEMEREDGGMGDDEDDED